MYKILIADDEIWVLRALQKQIDWKGLNAELVAIAHNGESALDLSVRLEPQILITDVKMPGMDGFSLIEHLEKKFPRLKFIIISGYSEFSLLKKAMLHRAVNYVLKPIDEADLNKSIHTAAEQIEEDKKQQLAYLAMKEKYLCLILDNPDLTDRALLDIMKNIHSDFWGNVYQGICIQICEYNKLLKVDFQNEPCCLDQAINSIFERIFTGEHILYFNCSKNPKLYYILLAHSSKEKESAKHLHDKALTITAELKKRIKSNYLLGVGTCQSHAMGLAKSCYEALYALQSAGHDHKEIVFYEDLQKTKADYALSSIVDFINEHYAEPITLESVAQQYYMNSSYLSRYFKSQTGENFTKYLTRIRMKGAIRLMNTTDLKIHEIALMVGYENMNYFSKLFRHFTGSTPSEFMRNLSQQDKV